MHARDIRFLYCRKARQCGFHTIYFDDISVTPSICLYRVLRQYYVGVLISLWLFLFLIFLLAAQPKQFFLDRLKKLEQRVISVWSSGGDISSKYIFFNPVACCFLYKAKDLSARPRTNSTEQGRSGEA
jgi:hypothetical protein